MVVVNRSRSGHETSITVFSGCPGWRLRSVVIRKLFTSCLAAKARCISACPLVKCAFTPATTRVTYPAGLTLTLPIGVGATAFAPTKASATAASSSTMIKINAALFITSPQLIRKIVVFRSVAAQRTRAVSWTCTRELQHSAAVWGHNAQIKIHQHGRLRGVGIVAGRACRALVHHVHSMFPEAAINQHAILHVVTLIAQCVVGQRIGNS